MYPRLIALLRAVVLTSVVIPSMLTASPARAQGADTQTGTIQGMVSTQHGDVKLPGVVVAIHGESDQPLNQQVSDENGHFAVPGLPAARYRLRASLDGFKPLEQEVVVAAGGVATVTFDLLISSVSEHVDVVANAPGTDAETLSSNEEVAAAEAQLLLPGLGVQSALRLMTGVIQVSGHNSIDGGRPYEAGMQVGAVTLVDPITNLATVQLPSSAIDSVSVLANPYEVEFGRFSSGLVVIQTKQAGDQWKTRVDNLLPALRLKRFTLLDVTGITVWQPSLEIGGPLVKGRLFLDQTVQYRYQTTDIPSRPETELKRDQMFSSLTRLDLKLSPRHSLAFLGGIVPSESDQATLGTFVPPAATVDLKDHADYGVVTERAILGRGSVLESTVALRRDRSDAAGQGTAPETLLPETTLGNFFNVQHRLGTIFQWTETASHSYKGLGGLHVVKVGSDLLRSGYDGSSESTSVQIARSDGTLARRLDFEGRSVQSVQSTDAAVFAQDRFQPAARVTIEFGGRLDRDGITANTNGTPRAGFAWQLNKSATATLRGGYGLFRERTPSVAGAFQQFESSTSTRFAADGVTPLGPPVRYVNVTAPGLQAARSSTWDLSFDERVNRFVSLHAGVLDREGSHALIVEPILTPQGGQYVMSSTGRSSYEQEEVEVHVGHGGRGELEASFVHSLAREDLNSLLNFVDVVLQPVIGTNAYAPAMSDAPERLLLRGRTRLTRGWQLLGTMDWRSGLPYSVVDEDLDFVGARNALRFPTYFRVDAGFERHVTVARMHAWVGLRVSNALNSFLPADVQANLDSPAYGSFYNSVYREYRISMRF